MLGGKGRLTREKKRPVGFEAAGQGDRQEGNHGTEATIGPDEAQSSSSRSETTEGLHTLTALAIYTRVRVTQNLLPLLQKSSTLARVISIAGGTKEGPIYMDDLQGMKVPLSGIHGHLSSVITLSQEGFTAQAPGVSFLHVFPGAVKTPLFNKVPSLLRLVARIVVTLTSFFLGSWLWIHAKKSRERSVFLSTSAAFPSKKEDKPKGVALVERLCVKKGIDREIGSGQYSVDYDGKELKKKTQDMLADYRRKGIVKKIWDHI
ncbi:hypothetical protein AFGD_012611 [Aspergillus flavus]|nr:hypothetical protein AFGD_012611 [Aspergillus flavus]